jgi:hypothetical protein
MASWRGWFRRDERSISLSVSGDTMLVVTHARDGESGYSRGLTPQGSWPATRCGHLALGDPLRAIRTCPVDRGPGPVDAPSPMRAQRGH